MREADVGSLSRKDYLRLERLVSRNFGYDEEEQIRGENRVRQQRRQVSKNKKTNITIDDEKVDLTKFEELKTYIRDQELIQENRAGGGEGGGARVETAAQYSRRKMNLYKKYFFRLINKTSDPFISAKYAAYVNSLLSAVAPSFYDRMERDNLKRQDFRRVIQKLALHQHQQARPSTKPAAPAPASASASAARRVNISVSLAGQGAEPACAEAAPSERTF